MRQKHKEAIDAACRELHARGIHFDQVSDFQIKVGSWSYYPTKETIFQDEADQKDQRRGLAVFIEILEQA